MPRLSGQLDREAKGDDRRSTVSDARSGETSRPAPNGVTAVSAQSAQAASPATPAAAIIAAVRAEASWATYFRDTQPSAPTQIRSLKIQLNPVELGTVTAHLRIEDDAVAVELSAETADAQRQLTSDAETIVRSLRALGLDVDRVTVQLAARSDAQPQAEPTGQSRQQGFAAEDGAGGAHGQGGGSQREQQQSGGQTSPASGPPGGASSRSSSARYI
jgi:chemotaxis protein MotD